MIIAIDIGKQGGIALMQGNYVCAYSMPVAGDDYDISEIARILKLSAGSTVVIEDVHSMPRQGVVSTFNFGRAKGIIEGIASALGMKVVKIHIPTWKKHYPEFAGLEKDEAKNKARELAAKYYPSVSAQLQRVKDNGIADALLIGRYYQQKVSP